MKLFGTKIDFFVLLTSYCLTFVMADLKAVSYEFESIFSMPIRAFSIWIPISVLQFGFFVYLLMNSKNERYIELAESITIPYLVHQITALLFSFFFARKKLLIAFSLLFCAQIMMLLITIRVNRIIKDSGHIFDLTDSLLSIWTFSLTLSWEIICTFVAWNCYVVQFTSLYDKNSAAIQLAAFIMTLISIAQLSILFAGVPLIANPVLQLPLIWGLLAVAHKWRTDVYNNEVILTAIISCTLLAALCFFYFVLSISISMRSYFKNLLDIESIQKKNINSIY